MIRHPKARRLLAVLVALLALLALAGCGSGSPGGGSSVAPDQTSFAGTTLTGASFDSAKNEGEPQVLWFWAPWCTVCRAESPDVAKVAASFDGKVDFVGIPGRGKLPEMRKFVSETGTGGFTHVSDVSGSLWQQFGITSQPSFVFVDSAGHGTRVVGKLDASELRSRVQKLAAG